MTHRTPPLPGPRRDRLRQQALRLLSLTTLLGAPAIEAFAACTDLGQQLSLAEGAFADAELGEVEQVLDAAIADLGCQSRLISFDEIDALFLLDATASLANDDEDGAVYAVIRAVTLDPDRAVPARYGPRVAELFDTWKRRLTAATATAEADGALRIDGRDVPSGVRWQGIAGEHLVQWLDRGIVRSEIRELVGDLRLTPGPSLTVRLAADGPSPILPAEPTPVVPIAPPPVAEPEPEPPVRGLKTPGIPAVWGTGLGFMALGGASLITGAVVEGRFKANPYDGTYDGLSTGDPGYDAARSDRINRDAGSIRAAYGVGYGLLGAGAILSVVGFAVQPNAERPVTLLLRPSGDGFALGVSAPLGGTRR